MELITRVWRRREFRRRLNWRLTLYVRRTGILIWDWLATGANGKRNGTDKSLVDRLIALVVR